MARPKIITGDVTRLTVRLPADTRAQLERKARQQNTTLAAVVRDALEQGAA
jgi:predicted transcriptional regulator